MTTPQTATAPPAGSDRPRALADVHAWKDAPTVSTVHRQEFRGPRTAGQEQDFLDAIAQVIRNETDTALRKIRDEAATGTEGMDPGYLRALAVQQRRAAMRVVR